MISLQDIVQENVTSKKLCKKLFKELLKNILQKVEQAKTREEKKELIYKRINIISVENSKTVNEFLEEDSIFYFKDEKDKLYNSTNVLAIAVCLADIEKVKYFLNYIDNINDPTLFVWGYRELYSLPHLVLDPFHHISISIKAEESQENAWKEILMELAKKGANFNWQGNGVYSNPPIAAGVVQGGKILKEIILSLRSTCVLFGANLNILGTWFSLRDADKEAIYMKAYLSLLNAIISNQPINHFILSRETKSQFEIFAKKLSFFNLDSIKVVVQNEEQENFIAQNFNKVNI